MGTVSSFVVDDGGTRLAGTLRGDGSPLLLLHGGPGLSVDYLEPLADELADQYAVAAYQQRGQTPSGSDGPFEISDHVDDVRRVLDALAGSARWSSATHGAAISRCTSHWRSPHRIGAVLAIDPLGGVGDGGSAEFEKEINDRTPPEVRDAHGARRAGDAGRRHRGRRAGEPGARVAGVLRRSGVRSPMPPIRMSIECYAGTLPSVFRELPRLEQGLPSIDLPVGSWSEAAARCRPPPRQTPPSASPVPGWSRPDGGTRVAAPGRVHRPDRSAPAGSPPFAAATDAR